MKQTLSKLKNILVVTLSNIGDVVMTTPVIMSLVAAFPEAHLTVVVGPKARAVLEKSPHIYRIVVYDKRADLSGKWRFLRELWKERYDMAVDLRNTAIPFLVGAPRRSPLFRKFSRINMRERHLEILMLMGLVPHASPVPFRFFDEKDESAFRAKLKERGVADPGGWILAAPGAASERKRWPAEHFREVIRALHERTGRKCLLAGTREERPAAEKIARELPGITAVLCGDLLLSETAALIAKASLVIANDSAIMHLGFELGTPTVGIFGPTDHDKYGHEGPKFRIAKEDPARCPCGSDRLPRAERSCFHGLAPEKVTSLCLELLKR